MRSEGVGVGVRSEGVRGEGVRVSETQVWHFTRDY